MAGEEPEDEPSDEPEEERGLIRLPEDRLPAEMDWAIIPDDMLVDANKVLDELKAAIRAEQLRRLIETHGKSRAQLTKLIANPPLNEEGEQVSYEQRCERMAQWHKSMQELWAEIEPLREFQPDLWVSNLSLPDPRNQGSGRCKVENIVVPSWMDDEEEIEMFEEEIRNDWDLRATGDVSHQCNGGLYEYDHEPSTQEMPGAPVYPPYYYYICLTCGDRTCDEGHRSEMICGMDLAGQPLYAGMTTQEVAEMCVCGDPEYGPGVCMNPECMAIDAGY